VALTYSTNETRLYVDAQIVATGPGVNLLPSASMLAQGFNVGNDWPLLRPLDGVLDELELFNYPLTQQTIESQDSDGDGLTDAFELQNGSNPFLLDSDGDGLDDHYEVLIHSRPMIQSLPDTLGATRLRPYVPIK
jgi:hypothetical protein